ncbi:hypothetical protein XELAEV_18036828mg [Xenopus laevis]|uniref:Uncharacterized protein n=1 Tax=Xenopus laevis TaxID=8355 RepID=A0A974H9M1_XENLA|nr:hypothetical protein XELAEV_18036828mg [Xenopus laevis]
MGVGISHNDYFAQALIARQGLLCAIALYTYLFGLAGAPGTNKQIFMSSQIFTFRRATKIAEQVQLNYFYNVSISSIQLTLFLGPRSPLIKAQVKPPGFRLTSSCAPSLRLSSAKPWAQLGFWLSLSVAESLGFPVQCVGIFGMCHVGCSVDSRVQVVELCRTILGVLGDHQATGQDCQSKRSKRL